MTDDKLPPEPELTAWEIAILSARWHKAYNEWRLRHRKNKPK